VSRTRDDALSDLQRVGRLVEQRVSPGGVFDGWGGRDVLSHLAAYARLVGAVLKGQAEGRRPTISELYGRELIVEELAMVGLDEVNEAIRREYEALSYQGALAFWRAMHERVLAQATLLTDEQLAAPGPSYPPNWWRPHFVDVVENLISHYESHISV
jgi:Mycothiol maleylpyruvate isomerase N-terminal domain